MRKVCKLLGKFCIIGSLLKYRRIRPSKFGWQIFKHIVNYISYANHRIVEKIRPIWIERVSRQLAHGESVRESFIQQLNEYFDMMKQAVITGDPSWMDNVLDRLG